MPCVATFLLLLTAIAIGCAGRGPVAAPRAGAVTEPPPRGSGDNEDDDEDGDEEDGQRNWREAHSATLVALNARRQLADYAGAIDAASRYIRAWDPVDQDPSARLTCAEHEGPKQCRQALHRTLIDVRGVVNRLSILEMLQTNLEGGDLAALDTLVPELMELKSNATAAEVRRVFKAMLRHDPDLRAWASRHGALTVEVELAPALAVFGGVRNAIERELIETGLTLSATPTAVVRITLEGDATGDSLRVTRPISPDYSKPWRKAAELKSKATPGGLRSFALESTAAIGPVGGDRSAVEFEAGAATRVFGETLPEAAASMERESSGWILKPLWTELVKAAHRHQLPE
jgi:hypothetical protein